MNMSKNRYAFPEEKIDVVKDFSMFSLNAEQDRFKNKMNEEFVKAVSDLNAHSTEDEVLVMMRIRKICGHYDIVMELIQSAYVDLGKLLGDFRGHIKTSPDGDYKMWDTPRPVSSQEQKIRDLHERYLKMFKDRIKDHTFIKMKM